jgi:FixJ family two-component response regulator
MSEGRPLNNDERHNDLSLVRRPSSAVEKAAPGAKRILSGMVADTLALVRKEQLAPPAISVAMCGYVDEMLQELIGLLLERALTTQATLELKSFAWTTDLIETARLSRFDLFILVLNPGIYSRKESIKRVPYREKVWEDAADEENAYDFIASLKQEFDKPIFVISNEGIYQIDYASKAKFKNSGVNSIFGMPFSSEEFELAAKMYLRVPNIGFPESKEITKQINRTRPLKIVIVNDEEGPLQSFKIIIQHWFGKNVELLLFENSDDAWIALTKSDPDLLITDDKMPGLTGEEICRRLLYKKTNYPIIVDSPWEPTEQWVQEFASRGLSVSFLPVPCDAECILSAVEAALKIPRAIAEPDAQETPVVADTDLESWYQTGEKYYFGRGVPKNYTEAIKWFRMAAERDHAEAQYLLGVCYKNGNGVTKDEAEAVKWYRKAAEQNHIRGQCYLGYCYGNGWGVAQDDKQAVHWFRKAAEQNYAIAQYNLGRAYLYEIGVVKDMVEAYKWFRLAEEEEAAMPLLASTRNLLSPVDLQEGERRYHEFQLKK